MSRINGSDALKMFEAYAAVYASEEKVEKVVEDIEQLNEIGVNFGGQAAVDKARNQQKAKAQSDAKLSVLRTQRFGSGGAPSAGKSASGAKVAPAAVKPAPAAVKPAPAAVKPAPAAVKPAPAAAPSAGSKVAPTAAKPAAGTKAAGPESIKPKTPNPLLAGGEIRRMQQASQMRQKGIDVTSSQLAAAERTKPSTLKQSYEYDAYDVVLEYLLGNGHAETVDEAHYIMLEMDAQMIGDIVEETLQEKLKPGTKRVQFSTGKDDKFNQAMTEKNPRTGRQRATSPELKAMGAHGRAKSAQYDAENHGDTEAAERNRKRREKIAHTVYRKTGRIIDRADND